MDKGTLKNKLKTFFTYDFLKVTAICVVICLVFTFAYYIVEKKPTEGQRFAILYADDVVLGEEVDSIIINAIDEETENSFSYDVLLIEPKQIMVSPEQSALSLLTTYSDLHDDDVFICTDTLLENYVQSARAQDLDLFVNNAFNYLYSNGFYSENGDINEDKIIKAFLDKYSKDNRFKKEEDLKLGKEYEIKRIKAIYSNATILKRVFEENPQIFDTTQTEIEVNGYKGRFAIDLGKLTGGEKSVFNSFKKAVYNEETKETSYTADGVYLLIGNKQQINGDLHFEGLAYIVSVLKTYSNLI